MARYLLTGAAGFIAYHVAGRLLDADHQIVGVDTFNDAYDPRLKRWRAETLGARAGFELVEGDIVDRDFLERLFAERGPFDACLNLAARAGVRPSVEDPWTYLQTNAAGALNLLELCRRHDVGKYVLASTSSLYGAHNPIPYREDADTNRPLSPYAASKKAAEALCYTYRHLYGLDVSVFRFFTVYGPAGRPDMSLFRFVQWVAEERPVVIYGDGSQSRDFTYVDDIARGVVAGLQPVGHAVMNLGSDQPVKLLDALRRVEAAVGKKARIEYQPMHRADVPATWADVSAAREKLGWRPEVDLDEGIRRSVAWYREHRDWARNIRTL